MGVCSQKQSKFRTSQIDTPSNDDSILGNVKEGQECRKPKQKLSTPSRFAQSNNTSKINTPHRRARSSFLDIRKQDMYLEQIRQQFDDAVPKLFVAKYSVTEQYIRSENIQYEVRDDIPISFIKPCLKKTTTFMYANDIEITKVCKRMQFCICKAQEVVFKQGDEASLFFVIEFGKCDLLIKDEIKKTLQQGDTFGELALLFNETRSATIKCTEDCGFWVLSRNSFNEFANEVAKGEFSENYQFFNKVKLFEFLTPDQKNQVCSSLVTLQYHEGENIVTQGEDADHFFIIKEGQVTCYRGESKIRSLKEGDFFGEQALYSNAIRQATIKADTEVLCLVLGRTDLQNILGDKIDITLRLNKVKWALSQCEWLNCLTESQIEKMNSKFTIQTYKPKQVILQKGALYKNLIILLNGSVRHSQGKIEQLSVIGEIYLLEEHRSLPINDKYYASQAATTAELSVDDFFEIAGSRKISEIMRNNLNSHELKYMNQKFSNIKQAEYREIQLSQLTPLTKTGINHYGTDFLVKCRTNLKLYKIKLFLKSRISHACKEKDVADYKDLCRQLQFPFLVQFLRTFNETNVIIFLEEFVNGQTMQQGLQQIGILNIGDCQFYIASILITLQYLHLQHVIYRCLSIEKIFVQKNGFIQLSLHPRMKKNPQGRFTTLVDCSIYSAPEQLIGQVYSFYVDLWALGIIFYELLCGKPPFEVTGNDPVSIMRAIQNKEMVFPSYVKDQSAKSLILQLCDRNPVCRLGGSYIALKQHSFFKNFNWDQLLERKKTPPFVPNQDIYSKKDIDSWFNKGDTIKALIKRQEGYQYSSQDAHKPDWDQDF